MTPFAIWMQIDLERELCRACDLDCFDDREVIERLLDELHARAYPSPTAPPRLVVHDGPVDVME